MLLIASFGLLGTAGVWAWLKYRTVLIVPVVVFLAVWVGTIVLYYLDDSLFDLLAGGIGRKTESLYLYSFSAFLLGAIIGGGGRPTQLRREPARRVASDPSRLGETAGGSELALCLRMSRWTLIAVGVIILPKYGILLLRYGNPFVALSAIRDDYALGALSFPLVLSAATLALNVAAANIGFLLSRMPDMPFGMRRPVRIYTAALLVLAFLNDATIADKGSLKLVALVACTAVYGHALLGRGKVRVRVRTTLTAVLIVSSFVGLLSLITYFRAGTPPELRDILPAHYYGDVVGNLPSSSVVIESVDHSPLPGWYTFAGFYDLVRRSGADLMHDAVLALDSYKAATKGIVYPGVVIRGAYNTTTYLAYAFADFGAGGAVALTFFGGFVCSRLFARAVLRRRVVDVQILGIVAVALVFTVRGAYFGAPGFWMTIAFLLMENRMLERSLSSGPVHTSPTRIPRAVGGVGLARSQRR